MQETKLCLHKNAAGVYVQQVQRWAKDNRLLIAFYFFVKADSEFKWII